MKITTQDPIHKRAESPSINNVGQRPTKRDASPNSKPQRGVIKMSPFQGLIISHYKNRKNMEPKRIKKTSIFATIPILLFGISWLLEDTILGFTFFLASFVLYLLILGIGWVKNFPKWTIYSIGTSVVLSLFLMQVSSPMLYRTEEWGIIALIPLVLTLIFSLLFRPSFQPLKQLYNQIKEEKNILILLFYGILPLILWMGFDEIHRPTLFIYPIILTIIIGVTIILYLENKSKKQRNLILIFGTVIPIIIAVIGIMNLFGV